MSKVENSVRHTGKQLSDNRVYTTPNQVYTIIKKIKSWRLLRLHHCESLTTFWIGRQASQIKSLERVTLWFHFHLCERRSEGFERVQTQNYKNFDINK